MTSAREAPPTPADVDELDLRVIELLRQDGRATNQALAQKLGVAAATVSARIRRLAQIRAMKVVAVTDFAALGYGVVLAIGVHVQGRACRGRRARPGEAPRGVCGAHHDRRLGYRDSGRAARLRLGADPVSLPQLDDLDRRILELLAEDARVSNRQLAEQLGVTEGTVRGRLKRLEADQLIRFSAITNVSLIGSRKVVLIGIQAQLSELPALCQKLAAMRES